MVRLPNQSLWGLIRVLCVGVAAVATTASPAQAQIVLGVASNISSISQQPRPLGRDGQAVASSFLVGSSSLSITSVELLANVDQNAQVPSTLLVQLFTSQGNSPGALLASESLSIGPVSGNPMLEFEAFFDAPVTLDADTRYWLVFAQQASGDSQTQAINVATVFNVPQPAPNPPLVPFAIQTFATPDAGLLTGIPPTFGSTLSDRTLAYNLIGSPTAVPEPGTLLLLGAAGMGLFGLRRRGA